MFLVPSELYSKLIQKVDSEFERTKLNDINEAESETENSMVSKDYSDDFQDTEKDQVTLEDVYSEVTDINKHLKEAESNSAANCIDKDNTFKDQSKSNITDKPDSVDINSRLKYDDSKKVSIENKTRYDEPCVPNTEMPIEERKVNDNSFLRSKPSNLKVHQAGEKNKFKKSQKHLCDVCNKFYSTNWVLKRHKMTINSNNKNITSADSIKAPSDMVNSYSISNFNSYKRKRPAISSLAKVQKRSAFKRKGTSIYDELKTNPLKLLKRSPLKRKIDEGSDFDRSVGKSLKLQQGEKRKLIADDDMRARKKQKFPVW